MNDFRDTTHLVSRAMRDGWSSDPAMAITVPLLMSSSNGDTT